MSHLLFIVAIIVVVLYRLGAFTRRGPIARWLFARNQASQQASASAPLNAPITPSTTAKPNLQPDQANLPASVLQRIEKEQANPMPWTSGLSVNDWLLSKRYKMKPLRLVLGTSYFQNGFSEQFYSNFYQSGEMEAVEHALYTSCQLALQRLQKEAQMLGANAVVAVRMQTPASRLFAHEVECTFTGTAVHIDGLPETEHPILCTVSMPELVKLLEAGSLPIGLSMGAGVYYENQSLTKMLRGFNLKNQEMPDCTRASYAAKHIAMEQLKASTQQLKGDGMIQHQARHFVRCIRAQGNDDQRILGFAIHFIVFGTVLIDGPAEAMPQFNLALAVNK